ncbi:MAG TPA: DUF2480 family protein [Phnomibacter sp.]|nr:DUF2480 family protein [Phnomibacter sp.]
MSDVLINKVADSGLLSLDLAAYYPQKEKTIIFDLKPFLFMEMILREKDFREALKNHDWTQYKDKYVGVTCTADAIIPVWAYMLAAVYLEPVALKVVMSGEAELDEKILLDNIRKIEVEEFTDKRVVVKGCGELPIGESAYLEVANKLRPVVKSIMYGEPCSTVPIYKKKL